MSAPCTPATPRTWLFRHSLRKLSVFECHTYPFSKSILVSTRCFLKPSGNFITTCHLTLLIVWSGCAGFAITRWLAQSTYKSSFSKTVCPIKTSLPRTNASSEVLRRLIVMTIASVTSTTSLRPSAYSTPRCVKVLSPSKLTTSPGKIVQTAPVSTSALVS